MSLHLHLYLHFNSRDTRREKKVHKLEACNFLNSSPVVGDCCWLFVVFPRHVYKPTQKSAHVYPNSPYLVVTLVRSQLGSYWPLWTIDDVDMLLRNATKLKMLLRHIHKSACYPMFNYSTESYNNWFCSFCLVKLTIGRPTTQLVITSHLTEGDN